MPRIALENRNLFRALLSRHFPELAKIPHAREDYPVVPNLKNQVSLFAHGLLAQMTRRILGRNFYRQSLHPDINLIWLRSTHGEKGQILSRLKTLQTEMETVLGLKWEANGEGTSDGDPRFTRNLFLVAEYAAWLASAQGLKP